MQNSWRDTFIENIPLISLWIILLLRFFELMEDLDGLTASGWNPLIIPILVVSPHLHPQTRKCWQSAISCALLLRYGRPHSFHCCPLPSKILGGSGLWDNFWRTICTPLQYCHAKDKETGSGFQGAARPCWRGPNKFTKVCPTSWDCLWNRWNHNHEKQQCQLMGSWC